MYPISMITFASLIVIRIVAIVVGFCFFLVFFFVPETFWDRTPRPHVKSKKHGHSLTNLFHPVSHEKKHATNPGEDGSLHIRKLVIDDSLPSEKNGRTTIAQRRQQKNTPHVGFVEPATSGDAEAPEAEPQQEKATLSSTNIKPLPAEAGNDNAVLQESDATKLAQSAIHEHADRVIPRGEGPKTPALRGFNSPYYLTKEKVDSDYLSHKSERDMSGATPGSTHTEPDSEVLNEKSPMGLQRYTTNLRNQPPKTYAETLKPWNGRLCHDKWLRVAFRPLILYAYPAILWSTLVYSLSIGWLIVLSESVTSIFRTSDTYNFTALQAGLVYISPFIGGVLGTAVAGKVSDIIVRFMSRRNEGVYEPEFRLVMAIPVTISTCIGLMGYGWSAQEKDNYMVPTVFFGIISFGCSLGSTTAITFAVDSYRQYAGEALVTLNFSKSESCVT